MKIIKRSTGPTSQGNAKPTLYNKSVMITYGTVNSNNNDGTCNIDLVTGFLQEGINIPSSYYPSKEPIAGGISYPPIGASVKILYPENDINSGWIEPASLNTKDSNVESELLGQGDKEILPGGWSKTFNQETGKATFINGTFNLEVDPDTNSFSLTDFEGNTFKSNGTVLEINGTIEVARKGDATIINGASDTAFIAWIANVSAVLNGLLPGSVPSIPTTATGEITGGSSKVKVG